MGNEYDKKMEIKYTDFDKINKKRKDYYENEIITERNHLMKLDMKIINNKLVINCYYEEDFLRTTFSNSFSLEELNNNSHYFRQFKTITNCLNEIIGYQKIKNHLYMGTK